MVKIVDRIVVRKFTWILFLTLIANKSPAQDLPNPQFTTGAINLNVTQANIQQTVCVRGYTKKIRPPVFFTNRLKNQQIRQYGYDDTNPKHYEEDHLIALSIGGAPDDARNLWPQPRNSEWNAKKKDQLEFVLFKMVCANQIGLKEAQQAMASDWITTWKKYVQIPYARSSR